MPDSATSTYVPNFQYMNFNLYTLHDSLAFFQNYSFLRLIIVDSKYYLRQKNEIYITSS